MGLLQIVIAPDHQVSWSLLSTYKERENRNQISFFFLKPKTEVWPFGVQTKPEPKLWCLPPNCNGLRASKARASKASKARWGKLGEGERGKVRASEARPDEEKQDMAEQGKGKQSKGKQDKGE